MVLSHSCAQAAVEATFGVTEVDGPTRSESGQILYLMPPAPVKRVSSTGQALIADVALKRVTAAKRPMVLSCNMLGMCYELVTERVTGVKQVA
jgi:hypothetical protein